MARPKKDAVAIDTPPGKKLSLIEKMKAAVPANKHTNTLEDSIYLNNIEEATTPVIALNISLGGRIRGGLEPGITVIAAPSRHFKSNIGLICVAAYLQKHKDDDSVCVFYDSEFGSSKKYFAAFGIDPTRVLHVPITNLEEFKFDVVQRLEQISRGEKIVMFLDSIGNLASKKELEDAINSKEVADMTRAKVLKGIFRMITPQLTMKSIPLVVIAHVYAELGLYPKTIMGGGTGMMLAAQTVLFVSRSQDKDKTTNELNGYDFNIIVEKSRRVKERSSIALSVSFKNGINRWSGLLDLAMEFGFVKMEKSGWYVRTCVEDDKLWRKNEIDCAKFWKPVFDGTNFEEAIELKFSLPSGEDTNVFEDDAAEVEETKSVVDGILEQHRKCDEGELNLVSDHE